MSVVNAAPHGKIDPNLCGPTAASATHHCLFRLLGCHHCGRTWTVQTDGVNELTPEHKPDCPTRIWTEVHTFTADNREGAGFPLTQTSKPSRA